jgi:hypothetical protein
VNVTMEKEVYVSDSAWDLADGRMTAGNRNLIPFLSNAHCIALHHIALTYLSIEAIISTHPSFETAVEAFSYSRKLELFGRDYQVQ